MGLKTQFICRRSERNTKVIVFSRGLGVGHVKRDLEVIKELKKRIQNMNVMFCSYGSGLKYLRKKGLNTVDMKAEFTFSYWETFIQSLITAYKIVTDFKPQLLIGDEEFYVPVVGKMLRVPVCFITNWFPDRNDVLGLSCLDVADLIIFPGLSSNVEVPSKLVSKVLFAGPILSSSSLKRIRSMPSKNILKRKLGYSTNQRLILVVGSTTLVDLGFLYISVKAFEVINKTFPETAMIAITSREVNKEEILEEADQKKENVKVINFVSNIISYMAASDLVITEGGYNLLGELLTVDTPAIFITFQQHRVQEQLIKTMQEKGVVIWIPREELSVSRLSYEIHRVLSDSNILSRMSEAKKDILKEFSAKKVVDAILQLL
jgi:UDP-N-acetylglucosamine:LPS N-acetylglucosamine transferase